MTWKSPKNTALIIVDVQNDFCPGGNLAVVGGDEIVPLVNELKTHFDNVVLTQDWHPQEHKSFASNHDQKSAFEVIQMPYGDQVLWPDHCVQGTPGAEFRSDLELTGSEFLLQKGTNVDIDSYSGFLENDKATPPHFADGKTLAEKLKEMGVDHVVLVGLAYDFCVGYHALDARHAGFSATVLKDATRAIGMVVNKDTGLTTENIMDDQLKFSGVMVLKNSRKQLQNFFGPPLGTAYSGGPASGPA